MSRIEISRVNKYYGDVHVLKDLDLVVEDGDFMTLLGPSGCGKTTTLRVIAGLESPRSGKVSIGGVVAADGEVSFNMPPAKRGVNLVFQSYALWPHMTVFDNVAFGLTIRKTPKAVIRAKVEGALSRLHISEFAGRYPSELSGGQQQRVAIARSIVSEPRVLLLDEPLSNLDAKLRIEMRSELKRLHQELKTTVVYVTHDQVEALTMSTRIAVFFEGRLVQADTPRGIYGNPVDIRVADFIGNPKINFVECECSRDGDAMVVESVLGRRVLRDVASRNARFGGLGVEPASCGGRSILAVRPEHVRVSREASPGAVRCRIYSALPAGSETLIQAAVNGDTVMAKVIGQEEFGLDEEAWLSLQEDKLNVYDKASGRISLGALA